MDDVTLARVHPDAKIDTDPAFYELLDRDQATSGLLEQQDQSSEITTSPQFNNDYKYNHHVPEGDSISFERSDDESKSPTTVFFEGSQVYMLTGDILSIFLSGCFLGMSSLGICIALLGDEPESPWSRHVIQATQIAPSIWPIVFSGVLGNAIRTLADWHAERGVSLLALEQLLGSLTMASSVITIFRMSILRTSSVILIFFWAFNPLGSQASLRSAHLQPRKGHSQGIIQFYSSNVTSHGLLSIFSKADPKAAMLSIIPTLYASTLHDSISGLQYVNLTNKAAAELVANLGGRSSVGIQAATDNWGNVRIPNLKYLRNYDPNDRLKWSNTPWDRGIQNYSSLVGDRIDGVNRTLVGNTTFIVQSSYQDFNCSAWFNLNTTGFNNSQADLWLIANTGRNLTASLNTPEEPESIRPFLLSAIKPYNTTTQQFVFGQYRKDSYNLSMTTCTPRTMYVDANVTCISKGTSSKTACGVAALRETPNPPGSPNQTVFDRMLSDGNKANHFAEFLSAGFASGQTSSDAEYYLFDPLSAVTASRAGSEESTSSIYSKRVDLSSLDIALFERRFSLLVNTLWKTSWLNQWVLGGNISFITDGTEVPPSTMLRDTTSFLTYPLPPTYKINKAWLAVYVISVEIMLLASMFSLIIRSYCSVPGILGYVSSLIRDSAYFQDYAPYKNSVEDGPDKTKRLGGLRVMIADVGSSTEGVGKIAFAPVGMGQRVRKRRFYS